MIAPLDLEQIRRNLERDCELVWFDKTDSTNEQALIKVKQGHGLPFACFAGEQTQGRGRRGKVWLSPAGGSVYMSLAWRFDLPVNELGGLSLAIGVAVARVLKAIGLSKIGLKWPNDVLVDSRKIAGILVETAQLRADKTTAVIGIGVNFSLSETSPQKPDQPWTDIVSSQPVQAVAVEPADVAARLLRECMLVCGDFVDLQSSLLDEYQQYDVCLQRPVDIYLEGGESLSGMVLGVENSGEIRILIDGEERLFNSADISLRKAGNAHN